MRGQKRLWRVPSSQSPPDSPVSSHARRRWLEISSRVPTCLKSDSCHGNRKGLGFRLEYWGNMPLVVLWDARAWTVSAKAGREKCWGGSRCNVWRSGREPSAVVVALYCQLIVVRIFAARLRLTVFLPDSSNVVGGWSIASPRPIIFVADSILPRAFGGGAQLC